MRIVLTGGGTGGHIIPNIALIEGLRKEAESKGEELEILYIGARTGVDRSVISKEGIPFKGIFCGKIRRYFSFENFLDFFKIPIGVVQAFWTISKFRPDVIFSKGGFVSVPVVVAGWMARRRIIVHESDVVPGLANRVAAKFAAEVCVAFQETVKFFRGKKVHVVGIPVRKDVTSGLKKEGYKMTGFKREMPIVLVVGGSQGAQQVNVLVWRSLKKLLPVCQTVHVCGRGKKGLALEGLDLKNYCQFDFLENDLPHLYAIADLIVSRAGATALAEIALLKKPSVLVPLPLASSRGDQIENAKIFAKKEVAVVLDPDRVTADSFFETVEDLVTHPSKLKQMEKNYEAFGENEAVEKIVELVVSS